MDIFLALLGTKRAPIQHDQERIADGFESIRTGIVRGWCVIHRKLHPARPICSVISVDPAFAAITGYNRREVYRRFYDRAAVAEAARLRLTLIRPIRQWRCPRPEGGTRGRPQIHSKEKPYSACG